MNTVASKVKKQLRPLVGLKLSIARLAANMRGFHFGEVQVVERGTIGEYALHLQCPWRIEGPEGLITGSSDLWEPDTEARASQQPSWTYENGNLQDERLGFLLKGYDPKTHSLVNETNNLVVENIEADAYGGVVICLSGGYRLAVFPCNIVSENWRFFRPGEKGGHFVIKGDTVYKHV